MNDKVIQPAVTGRPSLLPILSVNFVGTLGFSIVLRFLVFLVTKWVTSLIVTSLSVTAESLPG